VVKNIPIGQYMPGNSVVHRLDPRTKLLAVLAYIVVLFLADGVYAYLLLAAAAAAAFLTTRIRPGVILRGLRSIIILILITVSFNLFMTPGPALFRIGPLVATQTGAAVAAFMGARLVLLIVVTSLVTLTTSPIDLTDGLERLMKPGQRIGVPAHELAMMMTIALRFIPTLLEEADRIMKAQMARGADFESRNLVRRVRNLVPLLVPLFVSAFRRADELALAMEARCYRGGEGRTRMKQLRLGLLDAGAGALTLLLVGAVVVLRVVT